MSYNFNALQRCAEEIISVGRKLYQRGWTPATSSNFSARLDQHYCAVTVSGKDKGNLSLDDVMVVDLAGVPQEDKKPSAETLLHTQLYARDPAIGAVLHTHSPAATVLSMTMPGNTLVLRNYELQKAFTGVTTHEGELVIPVFDNTQDIAALAVEVERWFATHGQGVAYIIRGHGVYTWGKTMADCERHLEALEFLLECELRRMQLASH